MIITPVESDADARGAGGGPVVVLVQGIVWCGDGRVKGTIFGDDNEVTRIL